MLNWNVFPKERNKFGIAVGNIDLKVGTARQLTANRTLDHFARDNFMRFRIAQDHLKKFAVGNTLNLNLWKYNKLENDKKGQCNDRKRNEP